MSTDPDIVVFDAKVAVALALEAATGEVPRPEALSRQRLQYRVIGDDEIALNCLRQLVQRLATRPHRDPATALGRPLHCRPGRLQERR